MLTAQQMQKYTQSLFSQIYATDSYDTVKTLLYGWKDHHKNPAQAISTFLKITHLIATQQPELLDDLNRCLLKDYAPSSQTPSLSKVKQLAAEHPNAGPILDTLISWLRFEQPAPANGIILKPTQLE
jgi:hypothetical protein